MDPAEQGSSQITQTTANKLRGLWNPNSKPNEWKQTNRTGFKTGKDKQIVRWVTRSVSGGGTVVDFHALWGTYTFLRHFRVV
jgi:hypothetical protein